MEEIKKVATAEKDNTNPYKERFEFVLTVNDQIACQRYFRIIGFQKDAFSSIEFKDTVHHCVELIKNDLVSKSRIYLWLTSPLVFKNEEEMYAWGERQYKECKSPVYVIFEENENVYTWDGEKFEQYNGYYNRADYIRSSDEQEVVLKFSVLDNGREVISEAWSGNDYPKFIRMNIDLTNSKNKYETSDNFSAFESALIKAINNYDSVTQQMKRKDLIPTIVREICMCCSSKDDIEYTTSDIYGDKEYNFNISEEYNKRIAAMAKKYRRKTENYMKTLY